MKIQTEEKQVLGEATVTERTRGKGEEERITSGDVQYYCI